MQLGQRVGNKPLNSLILSTKHLNLWENSTLHLFHIVPQIDFSFFRLLKILSKYPKQAYFETF